MIIRYIGRAGRPVDPAIALLGNVREGVALDFLTNRAYVRDRGEPENFWLGDAGGKVTMSRPSGGGCWSEAGEYEWVGDNLLRLDHDPATGAPRWALVEASATNQFTRSIEIENAAWTKTTINVSAPPAAPAIGPDFRLRLLEANSSGAATRSIGRNITVTPGTIYAFTGFIAPREIRSAVVWLPGGFSNSASAGSVRCAFDFDTLSASVVFGAAYANMLDLRAVAIGNGVFGFVIVAEAFADSPWSATGAFSLRAYSGGNGSSNTYDAGDGFFVGCLQMETGWPTSYIPTYASQVTRAADIVKIPLASIPWNGGSGALKLNGGAVTPIVSGSDLDVSAVCAAEGIAHLENLVWVPA